MRPQIISHTYGMHSSLHSIPAIGMAGYQYLMPTASHTSLAGYQYLMPTASNAGNFRILSNQYHELNELNEFHELNELNEFMRDHMGHLSELHELVRHAVQVPNNGTAWSKPAKRFAMNSLNSIKIQSVKHKRIREIREIRGLKTFQATNNGDSWFENITSN